MHLAKTAEIVRWEMLEHTVKFEGKFDEGAIEDAVTQCLLELISMIEHDPHIESQLENGLTKSDEAIAQLLQYNCHQKDLVHLKDTHLIERLHLPFMLDSYSLQRQESDN